MAYGDVFASGRLATRALLTHCNTVSPFWLCKRSWPRKTPLSGFDFDSRFSKVVDSRERSFSGTDCVGQPQLVIAQPGNGKERRMKLVR